MTEQTNKNKKILVISHNAMNESSNGGRTLIELFGGVRVENIAQLFLHNDVPTAKICNNYYKVTDFDILNSIIKFKKPGKIVKRHEGGASESEQELYGKGSKRKSYMVLARNLAWNLNTWFTKDLKQWLNDFNPDIIFFMGGCYTFSHKLAMKISDYLEKPMITFWGDDYYLNNSLKNGFWGGINDASFKHTMRKIISKSQYICLDEKMKKDYERVFKKSGFYIYTASSIKSFENKEIGDRITMSFLGNISIQRYKSLIDIAEVICKDNLPIDLNVYSSEKRKWVLNNILNVDCLNFKGEIKYSDVIDTMNSSDILVHVEDFSQLSIKEVKYSFSTKIADSLSSNRCLFAYGPASVASIEYLIDNKCAIVATNKFELENKLKQLVEDRSIMGEFANEALKVANENHNSKKNWQKLTEIILEVCK